MSRVRQQELHSLLELPRPTSQEINDDILGPTVTIGPQFKTAVGGLGIIVALGVQASS